MIVSDLPIRIVDLAGSILMIVFSFLCLRTIRRIKTRDSNNVIWIYLSWISWALAIFAISRSAGHILKQVLVFSGHDVWWEYLSPFSGAINSSTFLIVAAITLFFERTWRIYQQILIDKQALNAAHQDLLYLNQNLEQLVAERTQALAKTEKQVAQAEKLASIGQLSAGIAHEINNPLGIILGYTQLLLRNEDRDSERYADLKTIEKHVRNCKNVVENLLNFARSSKPEMQPANMTDIIEEVIRLIARQARHQDIRIETRHDPSMPLLRMDARKIKQVLINLLVNATQAMESSGIIRITTEFRDDDHQAIVRVQDTGPGIAPEDLSRIFDPFFTTKPTGQGTGLGLSVSYGIVKDHNGDIQVESEPGRGTTFSIVLPVSPSGSQSETKGDPLWQSDGRTPAK